MQTLKALGTQGSWFARVGEQELPCVWQRWCHGNHYCAPGADSSDAKWKRYFQAIDQGAKVILAHEKIDDSGLWHRQGYVAVFSIKNAMLSDAGLEFDLVERIVNLK